MSGKHFMAHVMAGVFAGFDDRYINNFMGPSAQKHTIDDFNADNFDHAGTGFIRGAQLSIGTPNLEGGPLAFMTTKPAARCAAMGRRPTATTSSSITRGTARWSPRPRCCLTPGT